MILGQIHSYGQFGTVAHTVHVAGSSPPIDPLTTLLADAVFHIDASVFPVGTTNVTADIADLSPNGTTIQASGKSFPIVTYGVGGQLFFSNPFGRTDLSLEESVYPDVTVFNVTKPNSASTMGVWGADNGGWDRFHWNVRVAGHGGNVETPNIGLANRVNVSMIEFTSERINIFDMNESLNRKYVRRAPARTANTSSPLTVGAISVRGSYRFSGLIGELIFFHRQLTAPEKLLINAHLKAKWGLA